MNASKIYLTLIIIVGHTKCADDPASLYRKLSSNRRIKWLILTPLAESATSLYLFHKCRKEYPSDCLSIARFIFWRYRFRNLLWIMFFGSITQRLKYITRDSIKKSPSRTTKMKLTVTLTALVTTSSCLPTHGAPGDTLVQRTNWLTKRVSKRNLNDTVSTWNLTNITLTTVCTPPINWPLHILNKNWVRW